MKGLRLSGNCLVVEGAMVDAMSMCANLVERMRLVGRHVQSRPDWWIETGRWERIDVSANVDIRFGQRAMRH